MPNLARDWLTQGIADLAHAEECAAAGRHEWSCFVAHQAAEMSVKGLHLSLGQDSWGHTLRTLLQTLPPAIAVPSALLDAARVLDLHYIPARYPNGHASGAPTENYGAVQSREAVVHARQIVEFCRLQMARP